MLERVRCERSGSGGSYFDVARMIRKSVGIERAHDSPGHSDAKSSWLAMPILYERIVCRFMLSYL
jgi:hypothetical protein